MPTPRSALGTLGPAALTLLLGSWGITREDSMWRDEAATWEAAHRSLPDLAHLLDRIDVVHGAYHLFMHGVFAVLGDSLVTLRLPSVLAMAGATAAIAATASRLAGPRAGAAAGAAFALMPSTRHYAQEGHSYALVVAAVAVATLLLVTLMDGHGRPGRPTARLWTAYVTALLVAALLNWFSLLALPAHAATVLLAHHRGAPRLLTRWLTAAAVVVGGALPVILASRSQAHQVAWIRPLTWSTAPAPALLLALGAFCAILLKRRPATRTKVPTGDAVSPGLPLLALPLIALLIGTALATLVRSRRPLTALVLAASAALLPLQLDLRTPQSRVDDVLAPAETVAWTSRPGDGSFTGLDDPALAESPTASGSLQGTEKPSTYMPSTYIRKAMLRKHRILVVTDADDHPGGGRDTVRRRVLVDHFTRCADTETRGRRVQAYERGSRCAARPTGSSRVRAPGNEPLSTREGSARARRQGHVEP
ncbi:MULTISPECIES: glycosyltransferase family 39 protein [Streptomyces]|uniref:Uncharacterized protein n=1 Tax=Streptomyces venezuelae TaxID=54571 RepID=A0A5P2BGF1_STRVZ|nr:MULTISPECIES: glycosyltransferase family 39 protein [Streptomyces]NEA00264.1 hypothetical protein [Streptomyces sp. SID10116]MYY81643.1 hypothetical protein [Streptomyces sp. SID335]MYZ12777.1 hypothetical protein [Streptomyces sp. SID337]NEB44602.1 hypothetical protein [Streptomyces sp. SID339]QES29585.1 hypothetical protein DEJ47_26890 [Streptomyces venezuelae]